MEEKIRKDFGFAREEIRFVMRHKPTFLFNQTMESKDGIAQLQDFFVSKYGYDMELVRTLVVKYPFILSKSQEQLEATFSLLEARGV